MQTEELVVSDTSPLLNLALIDRLELLESQFSNITIPEQVWEELLVGDNGLEALESLRKTGFLSVVPVERTGLFVEILHELDRGETAAICYAIENESDLLLIDETDGREVARRHDLTVTGVIGILLHAANEGTITMEEELTKLREAGFWISESLSEKILSESER